MNNPATHNSTPLMTFKQLRKQCESVLSEATLRRMIKEGRIPYQQPRGPKGKLLFPADALSRLMSGPVHDNAAPSSGVPIKTKRTGPGPRWKGHAGANRKE